MHPRNVVEKVKLILAMHQYTINASSYPEKEWHLTNWSLFK